jgi:glycosyltransferase involved in cell wall biosynthesis
LRVLVLDTYYPAFLRAHYATSPHLDEESYETQHERLMARSFGTSDAYSHNLRLLGHDAAEIVVNCVPLQTQWAAEHGLRSIHSLLAPLLASGGRALARLTGVLHRITLAQVAAYRPDCVYVQDVGFHTTRQIEELRSRTRLVVGQLAYKAPPVAHLRAFDLITTSLPHFVSGFRGVGVPAEYLRIGFDERVLERLRAADPPPRADVVFVGGLDPRLHGEGVQLLEQTVPRLDADVAVYGYGAARLARSSPLRDRYRGEAWGLDMYRVQAGARIAINRHASWAEGCSNNMRLYEATGVGTALLTEASRNLFELFEPGIEVATYRDPDELAAAACNLLSNEPRRAALAAAGQARTLANHTYAHRMADLVPILEERLPSVRRPMSLQTE